MHKSIMLGERVIGEGQPTFIIAEIGINHNGKLEDAKKLIAAAKESGADAVKFQSYITEKRVPHSSPIFSILKQCELSFSEQEYLFKFAQDEFQIIAFSTPFDSESVDFLESIGNPIYKIASFDSVNKALLRRVGETQKPIIMSTGMTNIQELGEAWRALGGKEDGNGCNLALMHCITSYPTPVEEANLALIQYLKSVHSGPVGYSDHTLDNEAPILAVAAGAELLEKHFTLNRKEAGPDHAMSADPMSFGDMVRKVRRIEGILGEPEMRIRDVEKNFTIYRRQTI